MKTLFFGEPENQLFGVYHRPRGNAQQPVRAIVICPPIGQEYIRSHWCLRLLASQFARKGFHVLRFDYSGTGDSAGTVDEIQSLERWESDIQLATRQLKRESNASSVMLLGLRFGALLATKVAQYSRNVNSLMLWEPVAKGAGFLAQWRRLHSEMLDLWVCPMETENNSETEEMLGFRYSRPFSDEIEQVEIDWQNVHQPHLVVANKNQTTIVDVVGCPMRKMEQTDDEDAWSDLRQLETAWLRPQSTRKIVELTDDTFNRLNRFGILSNPITVSS